MCQCPNPVLLLPFLLSLCTTEAWGACPSVLHTVPLKCKVRRPCGRARASSTLTTEPEGQHKQAPRHSLQAPSAVCKGLREHNFLNRAPSQKEGIRRMGTAAPTEEKLETVLKDRSLSQDIKELTSAIHGEAKWGSRSRTLSKECPLMF